METNNYCNQWVSVNDELPKEHIKVLCFLSDGDIQVGKYIGRCDFDETILDWCFIFGIVNNVNYWMPLPKSPINSRTKNIKSNNKLTMFETDNTECKT